MAVQTDERDPAGRLGTIADPRPGRWVDTYDPEDTEQWARGGGRQLARRNLFFSIVAEFLGFTVWQLWSISAPFLLAAGTYGLTQDLVFWLIAVPNLVGATLRFPYSFAVGRFGGRNWTIISALLLVVPCLGLVYVVYNPGTPFWLMLLLAATAGFGGGNFASSMSNISYFFPEREKGSALGLNAAGGNIGVPVIQAVAPLVIVGGAALTTARPAIALIPLSVLAAVLAWRFMDNLSDAKADGGAWRLAGKDRHTWIMSFLYIGTFGSFIGYSSAFPSLIQNQFPVIPIGLAFLGPLAGALIRPVGGKLSDRVGGSIVTVASFALLGLGALGAILAISTGSALLFFLSFVVLFLASGIGNGSTYRMIPVIFRRGVQAGDRAATVTAKRTAAACIGIAAGIGAYGGFFIPRGFATSLGSFGSLVPALVALIGFYVVCILVTVVVYARRGALGMSERI
ncbi:nitrate/nitrite transporter [Pseudokineococcus sp. 1T1Z-3]|uniref:nitrate/nitrite transporter n=1 Tax=Pseudokineococcus sp. 1T1Z-3 TaxID=3132745 RepID=UPI0030B13B65